MSCGWFPMRHDEILAWVQAHESSLPTTLADLAQFPVAFRKVIVGFVSPEARVALWREHLMSFVSPESELTSDQQSFVAETADILPTLLAAPAPNPAIVAWEARIAGHFSRPQAALIFGTLGPPEPPEGLPLPSDAQPHSAT